LTDGNKTERSALKLVIIAKFVKKMIEVGKIAGVVATLVIDVMLKCIDKKYTMNLTITFIKKNYPKHH